MSATGLGLSQFLLDEAAKQLLKEPVAADPAKSDYVTNVEDWRAVQSGVNETGRDRWTAMPRFACTGRDMARIVQQDAGFPEIQIALSTLARRQPERAQAADDLFNAWLAELLPQALEIAYFQKWYLYRRIRPEEYGGRVHFSLIDETARAKYRLPDALLRSAKEGALREVNKHNHRFRGDDTYLLPQAYPEGCPCHPSYPASHAVAAGAAVTLLKALFDTAKPFASAVPTEDGSAVRDFRQSGTQLTLTTGGELNKLASNIAFGRGFAGIHYRSDLVQGLLLGEKLALNSLSAAKQKSGLIDGWGDFRGQRVQWNR